MSFWMLLVLLAVIKLPLAALMIWIPMHSDSARDDEDEIEDNGEPPDGEGGSKAPPIPPPDPHPRGPRRRSRSRGPHGEPSSPPRVRLPHVDRPAVLDQR